MTTLYDALYNYAIGRQGLTKWLHDEDIVKDYRNSRSFAGQQREALLGLLNGEARTLFQKYGENREEQGELEGYILFCQGLALGLQLGVRACF